MLKTNQEIFNEFDEKFEKELETTEIPKYISDKIKQFISKIRQEDREELVKDLNLKEQKSEDFATMNGCKDIESFCNGYNACKEYVEWVLNGRPNLM
jgi:predicted RNA-binding protein